MKTIRVGTRESALARAQTELVISALRARHPDLAFEPVPIKSAADAMPNARLDTVGGKGLFVRELEEALLRGTVDICVHSAKDMPVPGREECIIAAVGPRGDVRDALVLPPGRTEPDLTLPIGTSSPRRAAQLPRIIPGCRIAPVRGNIQTRLRKLENGEYGALILAMAGLKRLGLAERAARVLSTDEMLPAAGQGTLVVQGARGRDYDYLREYDDADAREALEAERGFVEKLGATCASPVAALARMDGSAIIMEALVADNEGRILRASMTGTRGKAHRLGRDMAQQMQRDLCTRAK